ncbi:TatD DNase family protein [Parabacteroides sp. PFB2-10]|uniref:TatD family hydrolase n=1 Tax=Parabacteroides sp. PFB2-10 TaxID=1742405 RepID=UPI002474177C|nr:TatD family hydrolase [Parabacteroides sp. PFB2-10]MDH6313864.1 TatD DNase family protein [Parabacteroides sp. PFB2-10]
MTPFPNLHMPHQMLYYNIHTHQSPSSPDEVAILNRIIREGEPSTDAPFRSYGIHPWYIEDKDKQLEELQQRLSQPETVALGEAGLDKLVATDMRLQQEVFYQQIELSETFQKPLIIHCVKAWPELLAAKKEFSPHIPWIIHGFRGKKELAEQLIAHGFYLSFGETFQAEALRAAWPSHALAETDESPTGIRSIYNRIAQSLRLPIEQVADTLAKNSRTLFPFHK